MPLVHWMWIPLPANGPSNTDEQPFMLSFVGEAIGKAATSANGVNCPGYLVVSNPSMTTHPRSVPFERKLFPGQPFGCYLAHRQLEISFSAVMFLCLANLLVSTVALSTEPAFGKPLVTLASVSIFIPCFFETLSRRADISASSQANYLPANQFPRTCHICTHGGGKRGGEFDADWRQTPYDGTDLAWTAEPWPRNTSPYQIANPVSTMPGSARGPSHCRYNDNVLPDRLPSPKVFLWRRMLVARQPFFFLLFQRSRSPVFGKISSFRPQMTSTLFFLSRKPNTAIELGPDMPRDRFDYGAPYRSRNLSRRSVHSLWQCFPHVMENLQQNRKKRFGFGIQPPVFSKWPPPDAPL